MIINLAITPSDRLKKCISGEASPRELSSREQISDKKPNKKKYHSVESIPLLMTTTPQCPVLASLNRHQQLVTVVLICITEVTKPVAYWHYKVLGLDSLCDFFYPLFFKHFSAACAPWDQECILHLTACSPIFCRHILSISSIFHNAILKTNIQSFRKNTGLYHHKLWSEFRS